MKAAQAASAHLATARTSGLRAAVNAAHLQRLARDGALARHIAGEKVAAVQEHNRVGMSDKAPKDTATKGRSALGSNSAGAIKGTALRTTPKGSPPPPAPAQMGLTRCQ